VEDVRELAELQLKLLSNAAKAVKPGGKLVFAVCTLTRAETGGVASAFSAAHPGWEPMELPVLREEAAKLGMKGQPMLTIWPQELGGNGMFVAAWRRK
jgi:16S rRNA (cytosine967-C5)-methyltransferase